MILFLLAYFGGVLTIVSPCILPVLPFVFARAGQPFVRSTLPLLAGMAITFAGVGAMAVLGGGWAVQANQYGRAAAMVLLALFGLTLLFPSLAERLSRPLVDLGTRLSRSADEAQGSGGRLGASVLLGVAIGLLWAPCAGPILGLVFTGAAIQGRGASAALLLLAYGLGAATSLALALQAGGRIMAAMKRSLGASEMIRRVLGVAVLAGVVVIGFRLDAKVLARWSLGSTTSIEQRLIDIFHPQDSTGSYAVPGSTLRVEGQMPSLAAAGPWLNSPPLTTEGLQGKVVLIDFWTYSCINCIRTLPYLRAWAEKYRDYGLVVIGVHAPEFAFERDTANVRQATQDLGVHYPVAIDNKLEVWRAFKNQYWPAHYFIDGQGRIRFHHFGEGKYAESERVIQTLLREAGVREVPDDLVRPDASGAQAQSDEANRRSPETYLGYSRAANFASGEMVREHDGTYAFPDTLAPDHWGLRGVWMVGHERALLRQARGAIRFRFHARDVHLVLAPAMNGAPVRFRVMIDGAPPGASHGVDSDADGAGVVTEQRLYQLIRQAGPISDHLFEIEFLDPGVQAFAFTFG